METEQMVALQEAIDLLPDAVVVVNADARIIRTNKQVLPTLGYDQEELIDQELDLIIPERFRSFQTELFGRYFSNPGFQRLGAGTQLFGLRKDNTEIDLDISLGPLEINGTTFVMAAIRDISSIRELERELLLKLEKQQVINTNLERFSYMLAHDLKSPLVNLQGILYLLNQELPGYVKGTLRQHFEAVNKSVGAMSDLISGITGYSGVSAHEQKEEPICLNDIKEELNKLIAVPGHIKVSYWPNGPGPAIRGNKTKLLQVFLNLLSNAIKYNNKPQGTVVFGYTDRGPDYLFSVADNGPGVPHELRTSIFDLFQKGYQSKENSQGIGLAIVKKIVEEKDGRVWVENNEQSGATFYFTWPKAAC